MKPHEFHMNSIPSEKQMIMPFDIAMFLNFNNLKIVFIFGGGERERAGEMDVVHLVTLSESGWMQLCVMNN